MLLAAFIVSIGRWGSIAGFCCGEDVSSWCGWSDASIVAAAMARGWCDAEMLRKRERGYFFVRFLGSESNAAEKQRTCAPRPRVCSC